MAVYAPGTRIAGRYLVAGAPLFGGMGIVYLCTDTRTGRPVAAEAEPRPLTLVPAPQAPSGAARLGSGCFDICFGQC